MSTEPVRTITLTVGTAGHIDHGKTSLVKFLTGCDTDRLPEEKERGMTIDLGFATCQLPNQRRVGIVDVPGHERFIHNMVAGAASIDVVLLVVAADDGVMPQTIEHFHIVRMLGIKTGMVVITKTDLAEPDRIATVTQQIKQLIAGSFLENAPIVPFSCKTGEGFDNFHSTFVHIVDQTVERSSDGPFMMHLERSFTLKGIGSIVSGIPRSGKIKLGDQLELLPGNEIKTVRGIQVYGNDSETALAGECVALKLSDLAKTDLKRGTVLAEPGFFEPAQYINARFQLLPHIERPLKSRTAIRFHIGTTDVPGHLVLPDLVPMRQGTENYVQFQLKNPVVTAPGDFFVVRTLSPVTTIGGGYVVSPVSTKMRRSRGNWLQDCTARETAFEKPVTAIEYVLANAEIEPVTLSKLAHMTFLNASATEKYLQPLLLNGTVIELQNKRYAHINILKDVENDVTATINRLHDEKPTSIGFPARVVLKDIKTDRLLVDRAIDNLVKSGEIISREAGLSLKSRATQLSPAQTRTAAKIEEIYMKAAFSTPRDDELPQLVGAPAPLIAPVLEHLIQSGILVRIDPAIILHNNHLAEAKDKLVTYLQEQESIEAGPFKDLVGTTRKYAIPMLEYFDKTALTRRVGNARLLREKR